MATDDDHVFASGDVSFSCNSRGSFDSRRCRHFECYLRYNSWRWRREILPSSSENCTRGRRFTYDVLRFGARWHGRGHVDNELLVAQGLASDTQAKTLPILAGTLLSMILHHSLLWHLEMLVVAGVRIFGDS